LGRQFPQLSKVVSTKASYLKRKRSSKQSSVTVTLTESSERRGSPHTRLSPRRVSAFGNLFTLRLVAFRGPERTHGCTVSSFPRIALDEISFSRPVPTKFPPEGFPVGGTL
jgi:hypothetical protein